MSTKELKRVIPRKSGLFVAIAALMMLVGTALAVHDEPGGPMELEGNLADDAALAASDWGSIFGTNGLEVAANLPVGTLDTTDVIRDFVPGASGPDISYHEPSNKDDQAIGPTGATWGCVSAQNPTDKTDIVNAYGMAVQGDGTAAEGDVAGGDGDTADDQLFYFGVERYDNSGDAFIGLWLFQDDVGCTADGKFVGSKQTGDILMLANFTGGGSNATIQLFRFTAGAGSNPGTFNDLVTVTGKCENTNEGPGLINDICATLNDTTNVVTPWIMEDKEKPGPPSPDAPKTLEPDQFVEGGVNITDIFAAANLGAPPCFGSFLAETRSSSSIDATLKDYALGDLQFCDGRITIGQTESNRVGDPHTFTVDVDQKTGATFAPALYGQVTFSLTGSNGISNPVSFDAAASTCDDDLDAGTGVDNLDANGQCTIVVNSSVTGKITANASVTLSQLGGIVRDTDPATTTIGSGPGGSGPAVKTYVDAKMSIAADDTNEVNDQHTFTVTVLEDDGDGTGFQPRSGATVVAVKDSGVGSITGGTCTTTVTNSSGQCTVTVNSTEAGQTVVSASTSFTLDGVPISLSTNGTAGNSGPATKKWVDASISIGTTDVNEVNDDHTFTVTVTAIPGTASPVVFGTITPTVSPASDTFTHTCATPDLSVANQATCTVTVNDAQPGVHTVNVSAQVTIGGVLLTRDTNPATASIGAGPGGSGPATKTFVDASITIGDSEVNEVGSQHVFTVTVTAYPAGTATTFDSITPSVLPAPGTYSDTCATPVVVANVATCTITINSSVAGTFVANASASVTMGGVTVTRDTDPATAGVGSGPGGSGPATKRYIDAAVAITADDTNGIKEQHVFDITVTAIPGSATPVVFTSITVSVSPAPTSQSNTCATPVVVANVATCTLTINSDVAETYVANATAVVTMGGLAVTRDTNPSTPAVSGPGGSGPATKIYLDGTLIWHKVDHNDEPLGGATFEVCRTHNLDSSTTPNSYVAVDPAVCVTVLDNSAPDADPADGEFLLVDLILGTYTVRETIAPAGFTIDNPDAVPAGSHTLADTELEIVDPFINTRLFRIIVFTCNDVTDTLVDSTVTLVGEGTVETVTDVPTHLADLGVTEVDICTVETGASWGELEEGDYDIDVELPDRAPLFPL